VLKSVNVYAVCMNIHTGASLKPCNFFVSSSVTVLFYTFSATCTSCAVITVRLAKPFEIEVKSSEENMYICSVNSGQWHTEKTCSGDELTGFYWVHLGCGPWFGCCCYKSCCLPTLTTFYAGLWQCWIIGFWTVKSSTVFRIIRI